MARLVLEESAYAGPIPENTVLPATVLAVKEDIKPWKDPDGKDIEKYSFTFQIMDPSSPWDGQKLWGETSKIFTTNVNCRLRSWVQELLGGNELPVGFSMDTDDLVGCDCRVVIGLREWDDRASGEHKTRNYVMDVMRAKGSVNTYVEEPF